MHVIHMFQPQPYSGWLLAWKITFNENCAVPSSGNWVGCQHLQLLEAIYYLRVQENPPIFLMKWPRNFLRHPSLFSLFQLLYMKIDYLLSVMYCVFFFGLSGILYSCSNALNYQRVRQLLAWQWSHVERLLKWPRWRKKMLISCCYAHPLQMIYLVVHHRYKAWSWQKRWMML